MVLAMATPLERHDSFLVDHKVIFPIILSRHFIGIFRNPRVHCNLNTADSPVFRKRCSAVTHVRFNLPGLGNGFFSIVLRSVGNCVFFKVAIISAL